MTTVLPMSNHWTSRDIPEQDGRVAIVTGANSGIGYETTRALAHKGAAVVMACRSEKKGANAAQRIRDEHPQGLVEVMILDLANLAAVHRFASDFREKHDHLDILINNAGVMRPPQRQETTDGFELQFGTNHLGHFALTGLLLGLMVHTAGSRMVVVSSLAHRAGRIQFDDLQSQRSYSATAAYAQSKLANLLFAYELQRRLEAAGSQSLVTAAHPGWTGTNLQRNYTLIRWLNPVLAQRPEKGARPVLYAAAAPSVQGGDYYGPDGLMELGGGPTRVHSSDRANDRDVAARLWAVSEALTGVEYEGLSGLTGKR
jgi:NAD(P)-dependent dehydrogenase (short-subunit alcohol dehydrogenase family)